MKEPVPAGFTSGVRPSRSSRASLRLAGASPRSTHPAYEEGPHAQSLGRLAGREVGYLSASQFSREYTRLFGCAPTRDVARLRQDGIMLDEGTR